MLLCFLAFVVCSSCISYLHLVGIHTISLRLLLYAGILAQTFIEKQNNLGHPPYHAVIHSTVHLRHSSKICDVY